MRVAPWLAGAVAALMIAGCGAQSVAPTQRQAAGLRARQAQVLTMKAAFAKADAHAKATYGDDFRPVMAFGEKVFAKDGTPQPTAWRFNMVGRLRGESTYSWMKLQILPDGTPFIEPKKGGPFPDRNGMNQLATLDLANGLDVEAGLRIVLDSRVGRKFPASIPFSWEVRPVDRLKVTAMTFRWTADTKEDGRWLCDVLLDPMTGEIIEQNAYRW